MKNKLNRWGILGRGSSLSYYSKAAIWFELLFASQQSKTKLYSQSTGFQFISSVFLNKLGTNYLKIFFLSLLTKSCKHLLPSVVLIAVSVLLK